jgi:hypothetical protein
MRKQELEITIAPDGTVSFTVKGVKGPDCLAETRFLEEALGGGVIAREKTSEYYEEGQGTSVGAYTGGDGTDE